MEKYHPISIESTDAIPLWYVIEKSKIFETNAKFMSPNPIGKEEWIKRRKEFKNSPELSIHIYEVIGYKNKTGTVVIIDVEISGNSYETI